MQAAPVFVQYLCLNEVELQLCDATRAQVSYNIAAISTLCVLLHTLPLGMMPALSWKKRKPLESGIILVEKSEIMPSFVIF